MLGDGVTAAESIAEGFAVADRRIHIAPMVGVFAEDGGRLDVV